MIQIVERKSERFLFKIKRKCRIKFFHIRAWSSLTIFQIQVKLLIRSTTDKLSINNYSTKISEGYSIKFLIFLFEKIEIEIDQFSSSILSKVNLKREMYSTFTLKKKIFQTWSKNCNFFLFFIFVPISRI